jgi:hypothetical protein
MNKLSLLLDEYELDQKEILEVRKTFTEPKNYELFDDVPIDTTGIFKYYIRLKDSFPSIPPGAFEKSIIRLHLPEDATSCSTDLMIRLHTSNRYYDFSFHLKANLISPE